MYFTFSDSLRVLGANFALRLLNAARPPTDYRLANYLPAVNLAGYQVGRGNMVVKTTMAGLVSMDAPYPPGGAVAIDTWYEQTAKIAIANDFNEATLRALQEIGREAQLAGGNAPRAVANALLDVSNKLVTQGLMDREEWMRGVVLSTGKLAWSMNRKTLNVDYGLPAANVLPNRTGNNAYGGSTSKFWDDWRTAQSILGFSGLTVIANPATIAKVVDNPANNAILTAQSADGSVTLQKQNVTSGGFPFMSGDARDNITMLSIPGNGEIIDLTDATPPPDTTRKVAFYPPGKITVMAPTGNVQIIGQGSTQVPAEALGYFHIGPTVEGDGAPGRWGRVFVPENRPYALRYEGAENCLPVITDPNLIVILSTDMT